MPITSGWGEVLTAAALRSRPSGAAYRRRAMMTAAIMTTRTITPITHIATRLTIGIIALSVLDDVWSERLQIFISGSPGQDLSVAKKLLAVTM